MKTVTKILAVIIAAMCVISCFAGCEKVVEDTEAVQGAVKSREALVGGVENDVAFD